MPWFRQRLLQEGTILDEIATGSIFPLCDLHHAALSIIPVTLEVAADLGRYRSATVAVACLSLWETATVVEVIL